MLGAEPLDFVGQIGFVSGAGQGAGRAGVKCESVSMASGCATAYELLLSCMVRSSQSLTT